MAWLIQAPANNVVVLTIYTIDLDCNDNLYVWKDSGLNMSSALSYNNCKSTIPATPFNITSSGPVMWVNFLASVSANNGNFAGFGAVVSFVPGMFS